MDDYGIRGLVLELFRSCLTESRQYGYIDTFESEIFNRLPQSCIQGNQLQVAIYTLYYNEVQMLHSIMECPNLLNQLISPGLFNLMNIGCPGMSRSGSAMIELIINKL